MCARGVLGVDPFLDLLEDEVSSGSSEGCPLALWSSDMSKGRLRGIIGSVGSGLVARTGFDDRCDRRPDFSSAGEERELVRLGGRKVKDEPESRV